MKRSWIAIVLVCLVALPVLAAAQNSWEIVRADYGTRGRRVDVTERVRSLVQGDSLNFKVSGNALGVPVQSGGTRVLRLQVKNVDDGTLRQISYRDRQRVNLQIAETEQSTLRIDRATYGSGYRNADVTDRLNSQIRGDQLSLQVNNDTMGGDPSPNQAKTLMVEYSQNGETNRLVINEGDTLRLLGGNNSSNLHINHATYGSGYRNADVTDRLNSQIRGDQLSLQVNNDTMGGDPSPNQAKTLTVQYSQNGRTNQAVVHEGETLRLAAVNTSSDLHIDHATYGSGYRNADVTDRLNSQIRSDQLNLQVNNDTMGGDPSPNQAKTLTVQYSQNGRTNQVVVNEGDTLRLSENQNDNNGDTGSYGTLRIDRATYGSGGRSADVTSRLNSQIRGDQLNLPVNSDTMGGDPAPNQAKTLTVQYAQNGRTNQVVVNEGDTLRLGARGSDYSQLPRRVRCESQSTDSVRTYCAANTSGGVRLSRRLSESDCVENSSWGYDTRGIWVDRGCRADFEVGNGRSTSAGAVTIPNGTQLSVRTNEPIDSKTANTGQVYSAVIAADVLDGYGAVTIPKGSDAELVIRSADGGGMTSGSDLLLDVNAITVSGTRYLVSTDDLKRQGAEGVGANKKTAIMVGGGAALGTLIGAIAGGGKGAAIGAAIGAGAGLGTEVLTKGKQVKVPAETLLNFRLDQDLRLQARR